MKKTFTSGLIIGALVMLPIASGSVYWVMKQWQQARAHVLLMEAHTYLEKNQSNWALAKLNQSVGAHPYHDLVHFSLAELYERTGDVDLALEEYQITKILCGDCYKIDKKIDLLQTKTKDKKK
jgi:Tfp pilus assembly protein PilF